ncbi:MAG: substrate-binding domain-containing protein, partial [Nocardiopsaceae bacterium]|nr:substrate-binding domain-containing protein [Nocardiopsaceae bacterium]
MRMRRHLFSAAAVAAAGLAAAGCTAPKSSGPSGGSKSTKVHIAFFGYAAANAYTQAALTGVKKVAARYGATVHFYDPNMNSTTQVAQIQDAATSGKYNAMVVYSVDGTAVPAAVRQALSNKIAVVADFVPIGPNIDTPAIQVQGVAGSVVVPIDQTGTDAGKLIAAACQGVNPCQ